MARWFACLTYNQWMPVSLNPFQNLCSCCFIEQETFLLLPRTGWFQERFKCDVHFKTELHLSQFLEASTRVWIDGLIFL